MFCADLLPKQSLCITQGSTNRFRSATCLPISACNLSSCAASSCSSVLSTEKDPDQPQQARRSFGAQCKAGSRAKPTAPRGPAGRQRMRCSGDRCLARLTWWHAMVPRSSSATRKRVGDVASSGCLLTLQLGDQAKHRPRQAFGRAGESLVLAISLGAPAAALRFRGLGPPPPCLQPTSKPHVAGEASQDRGRHVRHPSHATGPSNAVPFGEA